MPSKIKKPDPLQPSPQLLCKLGSAIVHIDEYLSSDGHPFDKREFEKLLADPEVVVWIKDMGPMLPVKRVKR